MKNVSTKAKKAIENGCPIFAFAKFVLSDGTDLTMTSQHDFFIDGNNYSESGGDSFPLGSAICKAINIVIDNHDDRYSKYDFYKAKITLYSEIEFESGTSERIQEGIFTVIDAVAPGDIIEFSAYDDMYKADIDFTSKLSYNEPVYPTILQLLQEICHYCDISLGSPSFLNSNFEIKEPPVGSTARQLIGYIAQIAGGNAIISDTGSLKIKSYDLDTYSSLYSISGGNISDSLQDIISGGELSDSLNISIDAQNFSEKSEYHLLHSFTSDPEIGTDDITVSGITTTSTNENNEDITHIYGSDTYALSIDNPLIKGNEDKAIKLIGDSVIGFTVRPFSGSFSPNPTMEFMDNVILLDRKYNTYQSFITANTFNYLGTSDVKNSTESPERNGASYSNNASEMYRKAKDIVNQNRNEWEKAVDNLKNTLDNASGLFSTAEIQPDGSSIYYFHDKQTLEESQIIIKITSQAMAISTDGGETYPTGITVDGQAILQQIYTIGLNADFINTGTMSADRIASGTLTLGGANNGRGILQILDSDGKEIGKWDNKGINVIKGSFTNKTEETGTSILGGKTRLYYGDNEIGSIGTNQLPNGSNKGVVFDLEPNGSYIAWAARSPEEGQGDYIIKFMYANQNFGDFQQGNLYLLCDLDFEGHNIKNGNLKNIGVSDSLTIFNDTNFNSYSDLNMNNFTISNTRLNNIVEINGSEPFSGTIPFEFNNIHVQNGLIVGYD